jgi:hypothetical protein
MFIQGKKDAIEVETYVPTSKADNDYVLGSEGRLLDRRSGKRVGVPAGRRYSDDLARLAMDGRFFVSASLIPAGQGSMLTRSLIDFRTEGPIGRTKAAVGLRYVPGRKTFVFLSWPSPRYIPIPGAPLEAAVARLFAEVVTCHELDPAGTIRPLDEATWDERRKQLAERLQDHPAPSPISRLAADPWHWLRRKLDAAKTDEDKIKYLDRLIAVEPTWQNYEQRALIHLRNQRRNQTARDFLEAGKRAGRGYWHDVWHWWVPRPPRGLTQFAGSLIRPATLTPQEYALGLRLAEALSGAIPEDRNRRMLLAGARYRAGRYAEALTLLEAWQRERERAIVSQEINGGDVVDGTAFLAMTHQRLGHRDRAQAALADLRTLSKRPGMDRLGESEDYRELLREAEALIEGRPKAVK